MMYSNLCLSFRETVPLKGHYILEHTLIIYITLQPEVYLIKRFKVLIIYKQYVQTHEIGICKTCVSICSN